MAGQAFFPPLTMQKDILNKDKVSKTYFIQDVSN